MIDALLHVQPLNTPTELSIPLRHLNLTTRIWGPEDAPPVIACHGWLDNAASFDHIAPLLPDCRLLALDLPGHGLSDRRPPGTAYHFLDMVSELFEVADHFDWERFSLLGHSMGAALARSRRERFRNASRSFCSSKDWDRSPNLLRRLRISCASPTNCGRRFPTNGCRSTFPKTWLWPHG